MEISTDNWLERIPAVRPIAFQHTQIAALNEPQNTRFDLGLAQPAILRD